MAMRVRVILIGTSTALRDFKFIDTFLSAGNGRRGIAVLIWWHLEAMPMHGAVLAEVALPNSADAARKKSLLFYLVSFESILDLNMAQSQRIADDTDG